MHPFMYGAATPSGTLSPSKGASILPSVQLVSSILIFLGSVMQLSVKLPPILFLVFLLI